VALFRRHREESPPVEQEVEVTLVTGDETLEVVGESYRQEALWRLVGGHTGEHVRTEVPIGSTSR
jgi:hypothetical protein